MARAQFRGRGPRRKTQWVGIGNADGTASLPTFVALTATTPAIIAVDMYAQGLSALADEEVTVTRMIGELYVDLNLTTANATATVAVGCAVARLEAIVAGVASLPDPEDDPDFEWLYYGVFGLSNPSNALKDGVGTQRIIHYDVRGQRIVRAGQNVVWIAQSITNNCRAFVAGRLLVKLP